MVHRMFCFSLLFLISGVSLLFTQLKDTKNQADYLIITPAQFQSTIQPFADWRKSKGLTVKVTELGQIYAEFGSSDSQQIVLRDFISYALQFWQQPKPRYVLLAGGTRYIRSLRVPSFLALESQGKEDSVSIDEWYAINKYETDTKPDVSIGRFPAENADELKSMIDKTIRFEDGLKREDYFYDFVFAADSTDGELFESTVANFLLTVSSTSPRYARIDFRPDSPYFGQRKDFFNAVEKTTLFLSYFGHGNPTRWATSNILTLSDVDSLCRQQQPFMLSSVACAQNFEVAEGTSIVNKLLAYPTSGAVASIASSGWNYLDEEYQFQSTVFTLARTNDQGRLGDFVLQAKRMLFAGETGHKDDPHRRMTILGDPALRWPLQIVTGINPTNLATPTTFTLSQNYPNPFNPTTTIEFSVGTYSYTSLRVFDVLGREVAMLVNESVLPGTYRVHFDAGSLPSGMYIYQLTAGTFRSTKRMVLLR